MKNEDMLRVDIAKRIRIAREQAGLSQGQVAKILGYNRPTITEIEAGRRRVSAEELIQLSKIFKVSVSWLTDESNDEIDPAVQLAARELGNLKKEDFNAVINFLNKMRNDTQ
jgi:transcriptional regulator with XRE-family HTH domain